MTASVEACYSQGEVKEKAIESTKELLAILEKEITGKKFFAGDSIGYLDLAIGWVPLGHSVVEEVGEMKVFEAEKFPCLHEWSKNFMDIPLVKECLPTRESIVEYFRG